MNTGINNSYLTVKEALHMLTLNGVDWSEVYFRILLSTKKVKSTKMFNSRVIPVEEVSRIIKAKKGK